MILKIAALALVIYSAIYLLACAWQQRGHTRD
jgi:hypothetical protein